MVVTAVFPAELVVGAHDSQASSLLHGRLKAGEIQLVEGTLVHFHIHVKSARFLVIDGKMLDTGGHVVFLNPLNLRHTHPGNQIGVLGHILKIPPAERGSVDVDSRREGNVLPPPPDLPAQGFPVFIGHFGVPGGGNRRNTGKRSGKIAGIPHIIAGFPIKLAAHPHWTIGEAEGRNAQTRNAFGIIHIVAVKHPELLFQRHLRNQGFNLLQHSLID